MTLTNIAIKNAKPKTKAYKLFDTRGLFLKVTPGGGKLWRFKFYFDNKEKSISLGSYPEVSLLKARKKRDEARELLADGINPSEHRKQQKFARDAENAITFELVAKEWVNHKSKRPKEKGGYAEKYAKDLLRRLEYDLLGPLGNQPIVALTAPEILKVLRRVEERGAFETAHRLLQNIGQIFRYAIATGRALRDPSRDLKDALAPVKKQHLAAIIDPNGVGQLLRAIESYEGSQIVRLALKLLPLVFVRPGELRNAEWSEIDFENQQWDIPAQKMKMNFPHIVPLSKQAIEILEELKDYTGNDTYLFPSPRTRERPLSNNAFTAALRRMGYEKGEMTAHGFRAMARTLLDEQLKQRPDYIEHQLAHAVHGPLGRAYNRTSFLDERRKMMQKWADYLEELRDSSNKQ